MMAHSTLTFLRSSLSLSRDSIFHLPMANHASHLNRSKIKKLADKAKASLSGSSNPAAEPSPLSKSTSAAPTNGTASRKLSAGATIDDLSTFGGEVETHDGAKTTFEQLLEKSGAGVVIFTYPKASTPGCEFDAFFSLSLDVRFLNLQC